MPPPGACPPTCFALFWAVFPNFLITYRARPHRTSLSCVALLGVLPRSPSVIPEISTTPEAQFQPATPFHTKLSTGGLNNASIFKNGEAPSVVICWQGAEGFQCACCEPRHSKANRPPRQDVEEGALRQDAELPRGRCEIAECCETARNTARSRREPGPPRPRREEAFLPGA